MKKATHPKWYPKAKVTCTCGSEFTVGSTLPKLEVEVCSACHPFYTGKEKFIDTEGQVEKFERRRLEAEKAAKKIEKKLEKKRKEKERKEKEERERPKTLKEMLAKINK